MTKNALPPSLKGFITDNKTGVRTEITKDIVNWRELAVGQKRRGFSGVFIEIQQPLEVCRDAMSLIQSAFNRDMLGLDMTFEIQKRIDTFNNGYCTMRYEKIVSIQLNPGTYEEYSEYLSIEGHTLTFDSLLRSVGKTKYDIPAAGLAAANNWAYLHNEVFINGEWEIPEESAIFLNGTFPAIATSTLSATLNDAKIPLGGAENDFKSQEYKSIEVGSTSSGPYPDTYFFMSAIEDQEVHLSIDFTALLSQATGLGSGGAVRIGIDVLDGNNNRISSFGNKDFGTPNISNPIQYTFDEDITLGSGQRLQINMSTQIPEQFKLIVKSANKFSVRYIDKPKLAMIIPAITPTTLANTLLSKMAGNDTAKTYTAQIDTDTDNPWPFNHYLVAAESIRGFENANFHANFNDFLEYMQFLGYEYEADEVARVLHFRKRADFFNPSVTALELSAREVANMKIAADSEYAYSTVRVGYEKPDIENTNGRFAMCGAFDYSTDFRNHGDNKDSSLEIMCPYKADPVEIETLSWTRGEKTTDQKADNDIFMLAGELSGGNVVESRQAQYMVEDTDLNRSVGWFNVPYIPYFIAKRNAGKIGVAVQNLTFTGTDAYRDAKLQGVVSDYPYSNIAVTGLFKPLTYEFDAGTHKALPTQAMRSGLVRLKWQGRTFQGYTKELIKNKYAEQSELWVLYAN